MGSGLVPSWAQEAMASLPSEAISSGYLLRGEVARHASFDIGHAGAAAIDLRRFSSRFATMALSAS